jgi:hypothetical protein
MARIVAIALLSTLVFGTRWSLSVFGPSYGLLDF